MNGLDRNAVPKIHPATRGIEPDDPMSLNGFEIPGDPELMLRTLVEEFAHMGCDVEDLMRLSSNAFYRALHGLLRHYGAEEFRRRVTEIISRCGVVRVTTHAAPSADEFVPLTLTTQGERSDDHGRCL